MSDFKKKLLLSIAAVAAVATGAVAGVSTPVQAATANVTDCSANSIIKCGVATPAKLVEKAKASAELQTVYMAFNIPKEKYDEFTKEAVMGTAKQDGTIVYNGTVVATNAWSIGREKFSYSTASPILDKTYYKSMHTDVLKQDLPAMLWFNDEGVLEAAVLSACGNPIGGKMVAPAYQCKQLNVKPVSQDTYSFTTDAPVTKGATVSKVVYDFGDGNSTTKASATESVSHTYAKAGTYTTKVTVYVKLPGGKEVSVSGTGCTTSITATKPPTPTPPTPTPPAPTPQPETPGKGAELPKTGPASVAGIFAGSSILGAVGYRLRASRRLSKVDTMLDNLTKNR